MKITNCIDNQGQRIEIRVAGQIGAENICGIIQHAIVEAYCNTFEELVLDLRQAKLDTPEQFCRLQSLLEMFRKVILQKDLRITVLFRQGEGDQLVHLNKAADFDGITLRSFINRDASIHFFGRDTRLLSTVQKKSRLPRQAGQVSLPF
jgi:hypothetical protein